MVEQYGHFAVSPPSAGKSPPQFGQFVVWYKSFSFNLDNHGFHRVLFVLVFINRVGPRPVCRWYEQPSYSKFPKMCVFSLLAKAGGTTMPLAFACYLLSPFPCSLSSCSGVSAGFCPASVGGVGCDSASNAWRPIFNSPSTCRLCTLQYRSRSECLRI